MPSTEEFNENDALHILPLSNIPLQVQALRETRLIKNAKLEGVIELYSDAATGSAQVTPEGLADVFDFSGDRVKDLLIVRKLADLPSYDVYSLRNSLAKANIEVDDVETLNLSEEMVDSLTTHMRTFTRPLVARIYGDDTEQAHTLQDVARLFTDRRADQARKNLSELAALLEINLADMPEFLETYADVYLSMAFYQKCHEDNAARFDALMRDLEGLAHAPSVQSRPAVARHFESAVGAFRTLNSAVSNILAALRARAVVMWEDLSARQFRKMTELVLGHQEKMGALLCAISVKLNAWRQYTASATTDSATDKARFVNSNLMHGLGGLTGLQFQDA